MFRAANKKVILLNLLLVLLTAGGTWLLWQRSERQKDNFSCTSELYISQDDTRLQAVIWYVFSDSSGTATLTGEVTTPDRRLLALNRTVLFHFTRHNERYLMQADEIIDSNFNEADNATLSRLLESFYLQQGKKVAYSIYASRNQAYLFTNGRFPIAWCSQGEKPENARRS